MRTPEEETSAPEVLRRVELMSLELISLVSMSLAKACGVGNQHGESDQERGRRGCDEERVVARREDDEGVARRGGRDRRRRRRDERRRA